MSNRKPKHPIKYIVLALVLAIVIASVVYVETYSRADEVAIAALVSTSDIASDVDVLIEKDWICFTPKEDSDTALIFYPGGKVEYKAYAPLMKALAEENITCILVDMRVILHSLELIRRMMLWRHILQLNIGILVGIR